MEVLSLTLRYVVEVQSPLKTVLKTVVPLNCWNMKLHAAYRIVQFQNFHGMLELDINIPYVLFICVLDLLLPINMY